MKTQISLRAFLALTGGAMLLSSQAFAATYYWDGTSASWNTVGNWSTASGATTPDPSALSTVLDDLIFNITTVNGAESITLGASQNARSLAFNNTGTTTLLGGGSARMLTLGTGGITIDASAGAVTLGDGTAANDVLLSLASGAQTWTNNSAANFTINNSTASFTRAAGSTLSFNQVGAGTFNISATSLPNDATGIIGRWAFFGTGANIKYAYNNAGTIAGYTGATAEVQTGWTTATTNYEVSTTTTQTLTGNRTGNTFRYSGTGLTIDLGASGANTLTANGILAAGASGTLTIQRTGGTGTVVVGSSNELVIAGPQNVTISAPVSGASGALTYSGSGTLLLSGVNTYGGATTVNSGTLEIGGAGQLGSGTYAQAVTIANGSTLTHSSSANQTLSGLLYGSGTLLKTGSGTLTLTPATVNNYAIGSINGFSGTTQITGGKIVLSNMGGAATTITNWATSLWKSVYDTTGTAGAGVGIDINAATTVGVLFGGLAGNVDISSAIESNWGTVTTLILNPQNGVSVSYGGILSNGAAGMTLTKIGQGTQTLTAANTYTGATTVGAGTLALAGINGSILNSASYTVRGGTLELDNSGGWNVGVGGRIADANAISLGSLTLKSQNGAGAQTETVGAATFATGGKVTIINGNGGSDQTTLAFTGAMTRSVGAAVDFVGTNGTLGAGVAGSPNVTNSVAWAGTQNSILPWATVGGTTWAEDNANSIRAFSGIFQTLGTATSTTQASQTGTASPSGSAIATNSLRVISDGTSNILDLGNNVVSFGSTNVAGTMGAILKSGTNPYTISASGTGSIRAGTSGAGTELIAHVDGGALTISAPLNTTIVNLAKGGTGDLILAGTRAASFTTVSIAGGQLEFQGLTTAITGVVSGAGGLTVNLNADQKLTLSNAGNSYTGPTIVKGGVLDVGNGVGLPGGTQTMFNYQNSSYAGSNLVLNGGVLLSNYGFGRTLGAGPDQVQVLAGTSGFSSSGLTFNLDNARELVWGSTYFQPTVFVLGNANLAAAMTLTNAIDLAGSTRTIMSDSASFGASLSGVIRTSSGTAGLTKAGRGTLTLTGVNTYNGATTINQGTLAANSTNALGNSSATNTLVFNGGVLQATGAITSAATRGVTLNSTGVINTNGQAVSIAGNMTGAGGLSKTGTNTLTLSGTNDYAGNTTVDAGTLLFTKQVSLYNNTPGSWTAANINVKNGATLALNVDSAGSAGFTSASLDTLLTNISVANTTAAGLQAGSILALDTGTATGSTFTQGNAIANSTGAYGGTIGLTKLGTGTLVLNQTNTYSGATTITAGTLNANASAALGDSSVTNTLILNGGTLQAAGTITSVAARGVNVAANSTIDTNGNNISIAGNVIGSGTLTKIGTGTLTLSGVNAHTGTTTVSAGTLTLSDALALQTSALVTTGAGTITLSGVTTPTFGGLSGATGNLSTIISNYNTVTALTLNPQSGSVTYGGIISDGTVGMTLTKTGAGTQVLSNTGNNYTGATTISGGILQVTGRINGTTGTALAFGGTGVFNVNEAAASAQHMTSLAFNKGDGTVQSTFTGTSANLTFDAAPSRSAGGAGVFIVSAGVIGTANTNANGTLGTNNIILAGQTGQAAMGVGYFAGTVSGNNYAFYDGAGFVRPLNYTNDVIPAGAATFTGAQASLASTAYAQLQSGGSVSGQLNGTTFTGLNIVNTGASTLQAFTLAGGATVTVNGILRTGNTTGLASATTISGGTGIQAANNAEMIIRTDLANDFLTITTPILANGTNALTKSGAGTLSLQGANAYTGNTFVNGGTLVIGSPTNSSLSGTLGSGGIYAGDVFIGSGAQLSVRSSSNQTLSGIISGDGKLFKGGNGTLILSDNNTYTGTTTVAPLASSVGGGILSVSSFNSVFTNAALGTVHSASSSLGAPTTVANGTITIGASVASTATLKYTGTGETTDRVLNFDFNSGSGHTLDASNASGLLKFTSAFTGGGSAGTLTLTGTGAAEMAGSIPNFYAGMPVTKSGTGTWTFSGVNTFTGATTVSNGILVLSNNLALQNSALNTTASIAGTGTVGLRTTVTSLTLGGLTGNKNFASTGGVFSTTSGGYGSVTALTLNPGLGVSSTYAGGIADGATGMTLTKTGLGAQTLTGTNTYTGATTVSAGSLIVDGSISTSTLTTVASGATLGGGGTVGALSFNGGAFFDLFQAVGSLNALDSSTISFATAGFGIDNLVSNGGAITWSGIANGTYTLINGTLDNTNLANFGVGNAYDIGGGRGAYFQNGSLQLVVATIPEPTTALLGCLGLLLVLRRRR